MANPNIVNVTTINANNSFKLLTTSFQEIVNNPASSGKVYKINNIVATNIDQLQTVQFDVNLYPQDDLGGTAVALVRGIVIPANASIIVVDKSTAIYLTEDQSNGAKATAINDVTVSVSWEEIS